MTFSGSRMNRDRRDAAFEKAVANLQPIPTLTVQSVAWPAEVVRCGDCDEDLSIGHRDGCIQEYERDMGLPPRCADCGVALQPSDDTYCRVCHILHEAEECTD